MESYGEFTMDFRLEKSFGYDEKLNGGLEGNVP